MSYGYGPSIFGQPHGKPVKSAFATGTHVIYKARSGQRAQGQVVGPDQDYFPSPAEVFVSFTSSGFTHLLPVGDLEVAEGVSKGD